MPSRSAILSLLKPSPSLAIVKSCFTIFELIARGVCIVVLVIVLISGSVAEGEAYLVEEGTDSGRAIEANIAVGWTIFLALVAIIYELFFIICRLLNFQFMIEYRLVYLIVDVVINFVIAFGFILGSVGLAIGTAYVNEIIFFHTVNYGDAEHLRRSAVFYKFAAACVSHLIYR
jgi:hypothetical protein